MTHSPTSIKIIESQLIHGDLIRIATITGLHINTVRNVFKADSITLNTSIVLDCATDLIKDRKSAEKKLLKKIA